MTATPADAGPDRLATLARAYALTPRQAALTGGLTATGSLRAATRATGLSYLAGRNALAELKSKFGVPGTPMLIGHLCAMLAAPDPARRPHHDLFDLTERQYRIAAALGIAKDRAEIAARLHVSPAVIDAELKQIYLVLGVNEAGEVVRLVVAATGEDGGAEAGGAGDVAHALPDARLDLFDGRTIGYSDYGPAGARPVLILHSTITARAPPTRLVEALQGAGYRPLAIDRPGFGGTTLAGRPPGYEQAADDAAAVAAALGITRLDVIARGSGQAAIVLARRRPALVGRVVLVNPTPHIGRTPVDTGPLGIVKRRFARQPHLVEAMIRALAGFGTPIRLRDGMIRSYRNSPPDLALVHRDPRFVADYLRATRGFVQGRIAGYVAEQVAWAKGFDVAPTPGMRDWRIVQARHYLLHEPEHAVGYWRERLPDTPVRWIEEAGQMLAYSHPGTVIAALID